MNTIVYHHFVVLHGPFPIYVYQERPPRRQLRDKQNVFTMPEEGFRKAFRLSRHLAKMLIDCLYIHRDASFDINGLPFHLQVLATLHFYGHGVFSNHRPPRIIRRINPLMISSIVTVITDLILSSLTPHTIVFPYTEMSKIHQKQLFYEAFGAVNVIGCIDCTQIRIVSPEVQELNMFNAASFNTDEYHSLNIELVCDAQQMVTMVNATYPGSIADCDAWHVSSIRKHMMDYFACSPVPAYLFADSDYPPEPWLMTPAPATAAAEAGYYNGVHARAMQRTRDTIADIRGRFRALYADNVLPLGPLAAGKVVCAILTVHNIAAGMPLRHPGPPPQPQPPQQQPPASLGTEICECQNDQMTDGGAASNRN